MFMDDAKEYLESLTLTNVKIIDASRSIDPISLLPLIKTEFTADGIHRAKIVFVLRTEKGTVE